MDDGYDGVGTIWQSNILSRSSARGWVPTIVWGFYMPDDGVVLNRGRLVRLGVESISLMRTTVMGWSDKTNMAYRDDDVLRLAKTISFLDS